MVGIVVSDTMLLIDFAEKIRRLAVLIRGLLAGLVTTLFVVPALAAARVAFFVPT